MPNETLEQRINAQQEKKEGEKPKAPTASQSVIEEANDALKKSVNYGLAFAGGALSTYFFGARAGLSTWGGRIVRERMANQLRDIPTTSEKVLEESVKATTMVPAVFYGVNFVRAIPKAFRLDDIALNISSYALPISPFVVGAAALGALTPLLSAVSHSIGWAIEKIKNKATKGIVEYFKENYKKDLIKRLPLSLLGATAIGVTYTYSALAPYLFPFLAATSMFYNALIEEGKVMYRRLFYLSTYVPNFANPFYLTSGIVTVGSKLYNGSRSLAYKAASGLRNLLDKLAPPIAPQTATAGAQA